MPPIERNFLQDVEELRRSRVIVKDVEIVDRTGFSKSVISSYLNGRVKPSRNFLDKFYEVYEQDLTKPKDKSSQKTNLLYNDAILLDLGNSIMMQVPLVTPYAYAGYLKGYGDAVFMDSLPRIPFIVEKEHKGSYIAIEVAGESMDNGTRAGYIAGDILLCREVPQQHWRDKLHIKKWDFVIATKTDGVLVKQISKHNAATGDITLHSLNPEYEDIQVNLNDVAKIFNVVQVSYKK